MVGALETIWTAHESTVWREAGVADAAPDSPMAQTSRQAALRGHVKIIDAIEDGDEDRAISLTSAHLTATRSSTLASGRYDTIQARLVSAGGSDSW